MMDSPITNAYYVKKYTVKGPNFSARNDLLSKSNVKLYSTILRQMLYPKSKMKGKTTKIPSWMQPENGNTNDQCMVTHGGLISTRYL